MFDKLPPHLEQIGKEQGWELIPTWDTKGFSMLLAYPTGDSLLKTQAEVQEFLMAMAKRKNEACLAALRLISASVQNQPKAKRKKK